MGSCYQNKSIYRITLLLTGIEELRIKVGEIPLIVGETYKYMHMYVLYI